MSELAKDIKNKINNPLKKFINFIARNIFMILFIAQVICFIFYINKVNYKEIDKVLLIAILILNIILILIERLHSIYRIMNQEKNSVKYDINIINMYVKTIKNLLILLGIIITTICLAILIKIFKI